MPKKKGDKNIKNPLRQGVPSKVYLLAYGGKLHNYKIKKILKFGWNDEGERVNPSDVQRIIKSFPEYFYQDEKNKKISSKSGVVLIPIKTHIDPLIKEMESTLKKTFTPETHETLHNFFDDDVIRSYVFSHVKKVDFKKDVDSFEYIMVVLHPIVKSMFFTKRQLEREKIPDYKVKKIFLQKNMFSRKLRNKGMTEQIIFNILSGYLPSDIKVKYKPNHTINIFKLFSMFFDLDNDILEILMKMPSSYEADIIMEASLAALPEVLDKTK